MPRTLGPRRRLALKPLVWGAVEIIVEFCLCDSAGSSIAVSTRHIRDDMHILRVALSVQCDCAREGTYSAAISSARSSPRSEMR